jgi:hypothetical protein
MGASQRDWSRHHGLACRIIRQRLQSRFTATSDELFGEALGHAWTQFERMHRRGMEPGKAVALAARSGASRAMRGTRFVRGSWGYVDVLDWRVGARAERLGDAATLPGRPDDARDPGDRRPVDAIVSSLPVELRTVARLLGEGLPRKAVCERLRLSAATVCRRVEQIRIALSAEA